MKTHKHGDNPCLLFVVILMLTHYYIIIQKGDSEPYIEIFHWVDDLVRYVKANFNESDARKIIPKGELKPYNKLSIGLGSELVINRLIVTVGYKLV